MKISERLALLRAGYTKAEINEMIDADANAPAEQPEAVTPAADDGVMRVMSALASEIKDLKTAVQKENIANTTLQTGAPMKAEDILASLINPPEKGEK